MFRENKDNQICYIFYIALLWSKDLLCRYLYALLTLLPYLWIYANYAIDILFLAGFALSFRNILRKLLANDILIYTGIMLVFFWSYIFYSSNYEYYVLHGQYVVSSVLPMFLIGVTLYRERDKRLNGVLYSLSLLTVLCFSLYTLVFGITSEDAVRAGSMDAAYKLLPHLCLVFGYMVKKPTFFNIAIFSLGFLILFSLGTRGAVLCLGIHAVLTLLFVRRFAHPILFFCSTVGFIVLLLYGGIFDLIYNFADSNGLSLRLFDKMKDGQFTSTSGRDIIAERVWKFIWVFPIGGAGLFADRVATGGFYAHNIILEILIEFGVFLGPILLVTILLIILRAFAAMRKMHDSEGLSLLLALFCSHFVKLFLSGSYLLESGFFMLIGFSLSVIRNYKKTQPLMQCKKSDPIEDNPSQNIPEEICSV